MSDTDHRASADEKKVLEQYLLQFLNLEKRFPLLPGIQNTEALAHIMGIEEEELTKLRNQFEQNTVSAAKEMLEDEQVTEWIDKLPFEKNDTIVAIGDSLTDDLQSWFYILQHALELAIPKANFNFINSGISYDTSIDALKRFNRDVIDHEPDWVIVALGTFDIQRLHVVPDRTLVSLADFWENINAMEELVTDLTDNPVVWITPPPVITEMMQEMRFFEYDIFEEDLNKIREVLAGKTGYIVDPRGQRMNEEDSEDGPARWNYLTDGVHPSLSGHVETAKELLRTLAESEAQKGSRFERTDENDESDT